MQKPLLAGLTGLSLLLIAVIAYNFAPVVPTATTGPKVGASIFPIADITRHIAGKSVEVVQILPAGVSPHTYEPRPSELRAITGASVVYTIGHNLDSWANGIAESTQAPVIIVDKNISLRAAPEIVHDESEDEEEEHEGPTDPHYWLDLNNGKIIAKTIAADLTTRFPDHADTFSSNLETYLGELDAGNTKIRTLLAPITQKNIITLHDAWYYFASAYGLNIVGTFEPAAGREPTPKYLAALKKAVTQHKVKTLYSEPGLSTDGIAVFAIDNGLRIHPLNPEGSDQLGDSYISVMIRNAETIRDNQ